MQALIEAVGRTKGIPPFRAAALVVIFHHNDVTRERYDGEEVFLTREGADRAMSRNRAKQHFGHEDHARATAQVECRKDEKVLDATPGAYKSIDAVRIA